MKHRITYSIIVLVLGLLAGFAVMQLAKCMGEEYSAYIATVTFLGFILAGVGIAYIWDELDAHMYVNKQLRKMDKNKHNVPPNQSER